MVTGDHVEMDVLQIAGNILKLETYLHYFKERMFSGLWLSSVTVGESSQGVARSVADTIIDEKTAKLIELQDIVSEAINSIFMEFLLEAGLTHGQAMRANILPELIFDDIDMELRLKKRENAIRLYEGNIMTETEVRREIGYDELTDEELNETYSRRVKKFLIDTESEWKVKIAKLQADAMAQQAKISAQASASRSTSTKPSAGAKKASNKVIPSNKSGAKLNSKKAVNK